MAADHGLMRPLRSENLKPRPSTQAVWEPRTPVEQPEETPAIPKAQPAPEPVVLEMPLPEPEPAMEPVPDPTPEPAPEVEPEPVPEPEEEPAYEDEGPAFAPYTESIFTFAPACAAQPEPPAQEPEEESWQPEAMEEPEAEETPFDLDAVIASILAQDDEDDEDEERSAAQDALPTEEMPEPAAVPLYEMPKAKPARKGWIWMITAALIVAAAGYAAKRFGWLN